MSLPPEYRILPADVAFWVPGFERDCGRARTLALAERDCASWYASFVDRLEHAIGRTFLPVCRMSDGEYRFCLGPQRPSVRWPWHRRLREEVRQGLSRMRRRGAFEARTLPGVSSGSYSAAERRRAEPGYARNVRLVAEKGILALHLSYGAVPFQEHYLPAFGRWLREHGIAITASNYVPFYFVYAALTGPRRRDLLGGRRLLVVHGATGAKRARIERALLEEGAESVAWAAISPSRSLFDTLDVRAFAGAVDLALVGAGVGKPNVLAQLEPLGVPAVDAGYVFEVWSDRRNAARRPYCLPDEA